MADLTTVGIKYIKKTLSIKEIQGQDLTVDVYYIDSTEALAPQPAILYFHGGFLVGAAYSRNIIRLTSTDIRRLRSYSKLAHTSLTSPKMDPHLSQLPLPPRIQCTRPG